jgi:hypothetical protein
VLAIVASCQLQTWVNMRPTVMKCQIPFLPFAMDVVLRIRPKLELMLSLLVRANRYRLQPLFKPPLPPFAATAPGQTGSPKQSATAGQTATQSAAKPIIGHKCFESDAWFDSFESVMTHKRIVHVHTVEAKLKRGKLLFHRSDSGFFECHCGARAVDSKRFVSHSCHCSLVFVPHDLMCTVCGSTFVNASDLNQHAGAKFSCNPRPIPATY